MREGWNSIKLVDAVEILNGFAFKSSRYVPEGIRVIRISNVQKGYVEDKDPKFYPVSSKDEIKKYLLQEGDLLMSLTGNVGRVGLLPGSMLPCALNQRVACLRIKNANLSKMFLFYLLNSNVFENMCIKSSSGVAQLNMSTEWLKEQVIPLPSLPEQQRIVDILDQEFAKIDALKANAEKSLQAAKDLFQATLKKELEPKEGWKRKQIGDLCEIYNGGTPSTSIASYWDGGIQWITPKDMGKSKEMYIAQCERNITKEGVEHSSAKVLPVRSVIISSRAPIGYVAINSVPMATNQGCKGFIPGKELYPEFLYYFFLSSTELLNKLGTGATFKEVSGRKLAEISLDYPDIERQQEIASHILSLSHSCSILQQNYQKTLTLCDDLKQSLLRKAFIGEL